MIQLVEGLALNLCIVITATYLLSLTYTTWRMETARKVILFRSAMASATSLFLMTQGVSFSNGTLLDLRALPLALITLKYGMWYGLFSILLVFLARGQFWHNFTSEDVSILICYTIASVYRYYATVESEEVPFQSYLYAPVLIFSGLLVYMFKLRSWDFGIFPSLMLLYFTNVLGFMAAGRIIHRHLMYLKLTDGLKEETLIDPLTRVFNRRQFELDKPGMREGDAIVVIDIDDFKKVNDTYGHAVGDQVLKELARRLVLTVRHSDRVYRLGGEEFAVYLTRCPEEYLTTIAERIKERIFSERFNTVGRVSVSGGLVRLSADTTIDAAFEQADQYLYQAKKSGKNRIITSI
ncbi:GGDEF domain-containing protein [Deinococcus roseus]|uniref:GGDEF domain-containing protein n=1 Tax=Deinococcus roseus TaxID=392414 RepID=A0ABQ2D116_9DEIO|nr:GGDEF domain-containing protein [Deinococcus roseus]GGJ40329.1 GGDEF domain-containing protein [Deinococcus roseus]